MSTFDSSPRVAVIGAGPAGLMAAEVAAKGGASVTIFERMPSPGRKLLLAGRGGLNLTHSEDEAAFRARYGDTADRLAPIIERFSPRDLRLWCADLGIETFVGSSGRVFPVSFKTSPLLRAWLRRLDAANVRFRLRHEWRGWDAQNRLQFATPDGEVAIEADAIILALGGASWPQLGSDGGWVERLVATGARVAPLQPANCGFTVAWSEAFRGKFEGQPLKNIALAADGRTARGDAMVTRAGLEGGPVYALAPALRAAIADHGEAVLHIAVRPDLPEAALAERLGRRRAKESLGNALRKTLGLSPVAIGLLHEAAMVDGRRLADMDAMALAHLANRIPVRLTAPMPLARSISTAGGVCFGAVDAHLMLTARPGTFAAGEMLDWEAPTGGYLLQACFATGVVAGKGALAWIGKGTKGGDRAQVLLCRRRGRGTAVGGGGGCREAQ